MNTVHKLRNAQEVEDEAAVWLARLDAEDVSDGTKLEFREWLAADIAHKKAYEALDATWLRLDDLETARRDEKVTVIRRGMLTRRRWLVGGGAVAASAAAAGVAGVALNFGVTGAHAKVYATAVGQNRTITLDDGSVIELNTNSIIEVDYASDIRSINLKKGEGFFNVAKDRDRPFVVTAGETEVRAIGTAFNVYLDEGSDVEVTVAEGVVDVSEKGKKQVKSIEVDAFSANEALSLSEGALRLKAGDALQREAKAVRVRHLEQPEIEKDLAWREGQLIFEGERLEIVLNELSRYSETRFIISDDAIRDKRVGGYFKTDDVDGLLTVLEEVLSVEVRRAGPKLVYLADAT